MPSNIEIKANYDDERLSSIKSLLGEKVENLLQVDTFFKSNEGRLKLREEVVNGKANCTLIGYIRTNDSGPSRSDFTKTCILNPLEMKQILTSTLGVAGVVRKERELYLVKDPDSALVSRVHIDLVDGLGRFLELEVIPKLQLPNEMLSAKGCGLLRTIDLIPSIPGNAGGGF